MANADKKKNRVPLLLLLAFAALVTTTIFTHYYSSRTAELSGPNSGVEALSTCGKQLIAISRDKEIYAWSWDNLSGRPQVGTIGSPKMAPMISDRLLSLPAGRKDIIAVSNLKGDKVIRQLSLGIGEECKYLVASQNSTFASVLSENDHFQNFVQLCVIDPNLTFIRPVLTKTLSDKTTLNYIGISNDGKLLAAVGGKDPAWIFVVDVEEKRILWEQTLQDSKAINNVIFSPDSQMVFASDSFRTIYQLDSKSGKVLRKLQIDEYKTPLNNPQTILCMAISPNGKLLAVTTEPGSSAWVWDIKTGDKIIVIGGGYTISGIAFSPDSSLLATGILVSSKISIWKIPEKP